MKRQNPAQWLKYIAPNEITLSVTADEAGMAHLVVAANPNMGVRMAKTAFKIFFSADEANRENVIPTPNGNLFKLEIQNPETGVKSTKGIIGFHGGKPSTSLPAATSKLPPTPIQKLALMA